MKEYFTLCGFLADKYDAVYTNNNTTGEETVDNNPSTSLRRQSRRCSSVVVNRFFNDDMRINKKRRSRCGVFLMLSGVLAIATGCFMFIANPYDLIFKLKITFSEGGETFELWRRPPVELYLKAYLFNITNKDAFLSGEEKLRVEQVGPYIYRELISHENVTFNENGTMNMMPKHPLVWVPELNSGSEDDILVLPNIALLSISNVVKDASYFTRMGLNLLIRQTDTHPLVEMTAKEFMFGYRSTLTTLGNKMMPSWITFDKIGLVDRMYDFKGDFATVYTGETDVRMAGIYDTYRGSQQLPQWEGACGKVTNSSDATKFPSLIQPDDTLDMYRKSICRAMPLVRTGETVVGGLKAYNYTWQEGVLDNGAHNPENKCFCRKGHCLPEGLIDVTDCYYGFPIALSYPHFYKCDPTLVEAVEGLNPQKDKHETFYVIQPESGLPLQLAVRFQINMALGDVTPISRVGRFSNMILPMMWTEIAMHHLPQELENKFYLYLNIAPVILDVSMYMMFICGPLLLIASIGRVFMKTWSERQQNDSEDNNDISRKHTNYIHADRRASIRAKEMEVYCSSLLIPQNENLSIVKSNVPEDNIV